MSRRVGVKKQRETKRERERELCPQIFYKEEVEFGSERRRRRRRVTPFTNHWAFSTWPCVDAGGRKHKHTQILAVFASYQ